MKSDPNLKGSIKNTGCDLFFVHHHLQIQIYRSYCSKEEYPRICFDATGSVVKPFIKKSGEQTKRIYLYEAMVYDQKSECSFRLFEMLSEAHDGIAIHNWMVKSSTNIEPPKETVCDQSIALLSAIVKAFTQYSTLEQYLRVCSFLIQGHYVDIPKCCVRCDIAHRIKLITKWDPLKKLNPIVREVYIRTMMLIIKAKKWKDICALVKSILFLH